MSNPKTPLGTLEPREDTMVSTKSKTKSKTKSTQGTQNCKKTAAEPNAFTSYRMDGNDGKDSVDHLSIKTL